MQLNFDMRESGKVKVYGEAYGEIVSIKNSEEYIVRYFYNGVNTTKSVHVSQIEFINENSH